MWLCVCVLWGLGLVLFSCCLGHTGPEQPWPRVKAQQAHSAYGHLPQASFFLPDSLGPSPEDPVSRGLPASCVPEGSLTQWL